MSETERPAALADALAACDKIESCLGDYLEMGGIEQMPVVRRVLRSQALEINELRKANARLDARLTAAGLESDEEIDGVPGPDLTRSPGTDIHFRERPVPGPTPVQPLPEGLRETQRKVHEGD